MTNGRFDHRWLTLVLLAIGATLQAPALHAQTPLAEAPATEPPAAEAAPAEAPEQDVVSESIQSLFNSLWVPQSRYTNGPHLRAVFRPVVAEVREATVEVRVGKRRIAYGGIVGPDGWVVTKASLIQGEVQCRLRDGREFDAAIVGVDIATDLAMLKLDAKNLPTLNLGSQPTVEKTQTVAIRPATPASVAAPPASSTENSGDLQAGDWLATVGLSRDPIAVGVVSVLPREIDKSPGFLGVQIDLNYVPTEDGVIGVRIETVTDGGGAQQAGIQPGDFITAVGRTPTTSPQGLKEAIGDRNPGDRVELTVQRGDERLEIVATLHGWAPNPAEQRAHYQNHLGGDLSERRFGFPTALQHDTVLSPNECGGPVVDLDGRVVAFNIARAGRTESYALPVSLVRSRLLDLMSGRLAPVGL
ncbi:S1C family serine protease [Botrimarina mediterranea]|uniref:S1C family serine protease n=1 Tax=Botrimarina mediterranea TaxID=2528022 RepID=UPI00118D07CD|nr:putative periplasmic serine endoprotease DegP-like precursor [Planctomycetes bacterium K2D]